MEPPEFIIDEPEYHLDDIPDDGDDDRRARLARAHIGLFAKWVIVRDLMAYDDPAAPAPDEVSAMEKVKSGEMTGSQYVNAIGDDRFHSDFVKPVAKDFVIGYYHQYLLELESIIGRREYEYLEEEVDFSLVSRHLDEAYAAFMMRPKSRSTLMTRLFG